MTRPGRIVGAGVVIALLVAGGGLTLERLRFGASDEAAAARVQDGVQQLFDSTTARLTLIADQAAADRELIRRAQRDTAESARLFALVDAAVSASAPRAAGATIYDATGTPLAWAGRVSDVSRERLAGSAGVFLATSGLGPRLVQIVPLTDTEPRRPAIRVATVVVEQALNGEEVGAELGGRFVLPTSLAPVTLGDVDPKLVPTPFSFIVHGQNGKPLATAEVAAGALAAARGRWREGVGAAVMSVAALTLLFCAAPLIDRRRRATTPGQLAWATLSVMIVLTLSRVAFWAASVPIDELRSLVGPVNLLLTALVAAPLAWLLVDAVERRRLLTPRPTLVTSGPYAGVRVVSVYLVSGAVAALGIWLYERVLRTIVSQTNVDLLHFSLHPLDANRLALAFALVLLHAAVIWTAVAIARVPSLIWRSGEWRYRILAAVAWFVGGGTALITAVSDPPSLTPVAPLLLAFTAAGLCAAAWTRLRSRERHASQSARLGALFLVLLAPSLAMYPSMLAFATQAKEQLIANEYGPEALNLRDDLQRRVTHSRDQIDALSALPEYVTATADAETPTTDRGFLVWSQTDLGTYRLTSSVELYRADGRLVSRFALNLPEYSPGLYTPTDCSWTIVDDISPIGASEPHVLRASRGICFRGRIVGGIIVRAMVDYRTLPFIAPQSPYLESLRPERRALAEDVQGRDVEFALYGWSRAPIDAAGPTVWTLPDRVFERTTASRQPFWDTLDRGDQRYRVYFLNDRGGIYALGYPVITSLGHLINLAELVMLTLVLFILLILGAMLFGTMTSRTLASGRALLREVRSSFYRKLFLAFWLGAVVPVVILAVLIRTYFATELQAGVTDAATKTVTVAQRLVEDYARLQQRGTTPEMLDDSVMVLVSRAIDEDVNLFDRSPETPYGLQATSERDLFASQLLSTRIPADVYRRVYLERAPTFVGQQTIGPISYLVAAARVRRGGREGIVTVPVTLRQREIEQQIDELDRRVLFGAVLFSLLGGALGYWMAERIADPVNRLTRATRRIARGDLDARVAATSRDELRRLVEDFNRMAADLKRQRTELERTQRLEAWADMARQVAHDIKNPLTPIQLSAEHAVRVNRDRGGPLSPVLEECVNAILGQVRLLRQIASEFSSFASSPTPRPESTDMAALIDEVVTPYRAGLSERIQLSVTSEPNLPRVNIDRTLFARALTNIIENALHAMPGGGTLTIVSRHSTPPETTPSSAEASPANRRQSVVVEVTDTGVGMDQDALKRIFEPYFSTKATGTGLGLTIAKRNVELIGGTIQVKSEKGIGTTVTLSLEP